jgi:Rps23 Pro-64 3,4-dihydroxylase Tpa1-like proline 4-hydroxylase
MDFSRSNIARLIVDKLKEDRDELVVRFRESGNIGHFYIDNLLPQEIALNCHEKFPSRSEMRELNSIREFKSVSAQMDKHAAILEEVLYAFQQPEVVKLFGYITGIKNLIPDSSLYAGGLSAMGYNQFLNPHLDNSHDNDQENWRVLNLLYYVSPDWELENGGNLEVWPDGVSGEPVTITSKFNRLAVMATHGGSWHSVSKVKVKKDRQCISNYYFSPEPLKVSDKKHVTIYKGRPEEPVKKILLDADAALRTGVRKVFKKGVRKNPHVYKKPKK